MAREIILDYEPQPRQELLHLTKARQILYGGAAGGGKSKALRWDAITFCLQNPGCQAYLFRRTLNELQKNHIVKLKQEFPDHLGLGRYSETHRAEQFSNGSVLYFCFCEKEKDVEIYQGAEMHWAGIDEAGQMTPYMIGYIKTRNRLGDWKPQKDAGILPRFVLTSNPGGPSHSYLKSIFIEKSPPEKLFYDETMKHPNKPEDKGWLSIFIPARMSDNKFIDEDYAASFGALPPELAKALREGDWDAVVGQALHTLSRTRHCLRPFVPPKHWTRFMSIDWGSTAPFSVGWYAVSDGARLEGREGFPERWLPAGAVIRYNEWYGWNGQPNQGARLPAQTVARGIVSREEERADRMDYRIGDTEMWAQRGGPSTAEYFIQTDPRLVLRQAQKDRARNYAEFLSRLAGNPRHMEDGRIEEDPMFFVTGNCLHFWRTVPSLTLDDTDPEKGPDKSLEAHVYDEVAYGLRSRPFVMTKDDRWIQEHGEAEEEAIGKVDDPYATA